MADKIQHLVVWSEVPVSDLDKAAAFYGTVLDVATSRDDSGPNPIINIGSMAGDVVSGHLYPGKPAARGTGSTVHFGVRALEEALARVGPAGGEVVSPIITIPPGRFAYCLDPDGNSIGLFQSHA